MSVDRKEPSFVDLFGVESEVQADAPGRVNVIGEHTDYNGGFVLPAAIPQRTRVQLARRADGLVEAWSRDIAPGGDRRTYTVGAESPQSDWTDYIQGVTHVLTRGGHALGGFQVRIESDVPLGSGLSSSAALEMSLLRALREAFGLALSDIDLARLGQRVETVFVGAPIGIMDQMACSLADEHHVLFLDTRSLEHERIPIPAAAQLVVIDSGVAHSHAAGDYRRRRAECEEAAARLGVRELRDVTPAMLDAVDALPDPLGRRARHVVTENARVLETVAALRQEDLETVGALLSQSHQSMRDDFEVSIPEMDRLVAIAEGHDGVYGARLTGGGFGGAAVILARKELAQELAARIAGQYSRETGRPGKVLVPQ